MLLNLLVDSYTDFGLNKMQWTNHQPHQQITLHPKSLQTKETTHWTLFDICASALFLHTLGPWFQNQDHWFQNHWFQNYKSSQVLFPLIPGCCLWFRSGNHCAQDICAWWLLNPRTAASVHFLRSSSRFLNLLFLTTHSSLCSLLLLVHRSLPHSSLLVNLPSVYFETALHDWILMIAATTWHTCYVYVNVDLFHCILNGSKKKWSEPITFLWYFYLDSQFQYMCVTLFSENWERIRTCN